MNAIHPHRNSRTRRALHAVAVLLGCSAVLPGPSHASLLSGDALDTMANVIAWLALIIVPVVLITVFWLVHILPEQIAEKRRHPQLAAIKTLCLLSLVFGGLLWPLAWLWAYTKPVLHKMAYGTDVADHPAHGEALTPLHDAEAAEPAEPARNGPDIVRADNRQDEVDELKRRIRSLEMALAMASDPARGTPNRLRATGDDEE